MTFSKNKKHRILISWSILTVIFILVYQLFILDHSVTTPLQMQRARDYMKTLNETVQREREKRGIPIDRKLDPNHTGLIGTEHSIITTTLGHLEAKRTSVNPDNAGLVVKLFQKMGLKPGDTVAIGSSASFPGLILATLSACKVLELKPLYMISLGSSQYGANIPDFTIIDILTALEEKHGKLFRPLAVSYGGNNDTGKGLSEEGKKLIEAKIKQTGYRLIYESDFEKNIHKRLTLYNEAAKDTIKCFVNIGGAIANIGKSAAILNLEPGLNREIESIPSKQTRGVLFEFADREIPTIHLLYIKGLSIKYGLVWDPIPFRDNTLKKLYTIDEKQKKAYFVFFAGYVLSMLGSFLAVLFISQKRWYNQ